MTLWAIVPVKPLRRKSRLAGTLSEDERTQLNQLLLEHTLKTLTDLKEIEQILVVSRDPAALSLARDHGARTVREAAGSPHLNTALTRATVVAQVYATRGVLVLPADLPLMTREDILALVERATEPPVVVIAPDRREEGTNALLICPAGLIEYDFGIGSFQRHCERARQANARLEVVTLPSLGLDLDLPEDLDEVLNLEGLNVERFITVEETS